MRAVQVAAVVAVFAQTSYAWAAAPEAMLGSPLPKARPGAARTAPADLPKAPSGPGRAAARFSSTLDSLVPETRATTRGANESRVYRSVSPAVVLVLSEDGVGSGALISADGQIITNMHVVGDAEEVGIIFKPAVEGAEVGEADIRAAKVVRRDEIADLALLKVSEVPEGVKPLAIGALTDVTVGSDVHAIGHPSGGAWTYTRGIVSQIRRNYTWAAEDRIRHTANVIQTQTPINPGNSGGPLIDDNLAIVGVNSFKGEGEGLNFAVSADDVKAFLARTEDRLVDPEEKRQAAAEACEVEALDVLPARDVKGRSFLMDDDCDGESDFIAMIPDDEKEPILFLYDEDEDGRIDAIYADEGRDDDIDSALFDTDGNGKFDMAGDFKDGESEPYRYERISEDDER